MIFISALLANECMNCHQKEAKHCHGSNHFTLKKALMLMLKGWHIDANVTLQNFKKVVKDKLAYDFIAKKCVRCHIASPTMQNGGNRGNLCLSCHNPHRSSADAKLARASMRKCLKCHNANFVGADFLGLFPKDFDKSYRAPIDISGHYPPTLGNIDYHHLQPDIHYIKGFDCMDCHNNKVSPRGWEHVRCSDCHKMKHHPKAYHRRIDCITCHAMWQVNSYSADVVRIDKQDYSEYKRWSLCEDEELCEIIKHNRAPYMKDYITGKKSLGVWFINYRFRRWEQFLLVEKGGKIELARPLFDFYLTYIDKNGKTKVDAKHLGGFVIAKPHTIARIGKSCEHCHENKILFEKKSPFTGKILEGRRLEDETLKRLHSMRYKLKRAKLLWYNTFPQ